MKTLIMAGVGALVALFTGCSTIEVSSEGAMNKGERLLSIQSDGYAIVDLIPLWSGTASVNKKGELERSFAMFRDHTHSDELYAVAKAYAEAQNCELENVVFMNNYRGIDTANCYGLITIYDVSISAVLKAK